MVGIKTLFRQRIEDQLCNIGLMSFIRYTKKNPYKPHNDKTESLFIHIPRAAGSSFSAALYDGQDTGHSSARDYYLFNKEKYHSYYKFTVIRNPFQKIHSGFLQTKKKMEEGNSGTAIWGDKYIGDESFETFVLNLKKNTLKSRCILAFTHFRTQSSYLKINGKIDLDFIGNFENLELAYSHIARELNIDTKLEHLNATNRPRIDDVYSLKMKKVIQEIYHEDFQIIKETK